MPGHGVVKAAPDQVQINAGVSTSAPTAAQALTANTARMKGVFDALRKLGVPEKTSRPSISRSRRNIPAAATMNGPN